MMYSQQMAVAVKSNGVVLREFENTVHDSTVYLPFGQEFSLFFKNLNTVRASVSVEIDGKSVTGDHKLIVAANSTLDLERYIHEGNLDTGNKFKFIERSESIEQHRGIGAEDGLIRIEFEFERYIPCLSGLYGSLFGRTNGVNGAGNTRAIGDWIDNANFTGAKGASASPTWSTCSADHTTLSNASLINKSGDFMSSEVNLNTAGITVPGSKSTQQFRVVSELIGDGVKHVIVLQLKGQTETKKVVEPVTVKKKLECNYCGKLNAVNSKFCGECGAGLEIF